MHITEHAQLRYVQRILNIPNEDEAMQFVRGHEEEITKRIRFLCMDSSLFFKNFPLRTGGGDSRNVYLHDDIILLVSQDNETLITLYRVITDDNEEQHMWNMQSFIERVQISNEEIEKIGKQKKEQDAHSRKLEFMRDRLKKQVEELEAEIEESIEHSRELYTNAKKLKNENYDIIRKVLYGFKHVKPTKKTSVS